MTFKLIAEWLKGPTENVFIWGNFFYRNVGDITERYDITNPSAPVLLREYPHTGIAIGAGYQTGRFLVANDRCFIVSNFGGGAQVVDINTGTSVLVGTDSSVEGVALWANNLILGQGNIIKILDVSNPGSPVVIRQFASGTGSLGVYTNGVYIASSNERTLTVYDFNGNLLWQYTWPWTTTTNPENYLEVVMDVAFLPGMIIASTRNGVFHVFDNSGNHITQYPAKGSEYGTATKITSYRNDSIVAAFHDINVQLLRISGTSVILEGTFDYASQIGGYPRSIWAVGNTAALANSYKGAGLIELPGMTLYKKFPGYDRVNTVVSSTDRKYAYAGGDATFSVYDMQNLTMVGQTDYNHPARAWSSIAIDRSRNLVFIPATWGSLKTINVNNPANPVVLSSFAVPANIDGWNYVDGVSLPLGNSQIFIENASRLFRIDYTNPSNPVVVGSPLSTLSGFSDIILSPDGRYAYLAMGSTLVVVDVSNPSSMIQVTTISLPYLIEKMRRVGNRLWMTVYTYGLKYFDITNPANPVDSGIYYNPIGSADALCAIGLNELVVGMKDHIVRLNISNPNSPVIVEDIAVPNADIVFADFYESGNTLIVSTYSMGIKVYTDPTINVGPIRYNCSGPEGGYQCYPASGGTYADLATCQSVCKGAPSPPPTTTPPSRTLTSITITPSSSSINIGKYQLFTATAKDQNGIPMSGVTIDWSGSDNGVLSTIAPRQVTTDVNGEGRTTVTGTAPGTLTLYARSGTVTGTSTVVITSPQPTQLGIISCSTTPPGAHIFVGTFDTQLTTPNDIGMVPAGNWDVKFTLAGYKDCIVNVNVIANSTVNASCNMVPLVTPPPTTVPPSRTLTSITITPSSSSINIGKYQLFTATAKDQNGIPMSGVTIDWSGSDNGVLSTIAPRQVTTDVNGEGRTTVTGIASGILVLSAKSGLISGTSIILINIPTPPPTTIPPVVCPFDSVNIFGTCIKKEYLIAAGVGFVILKLL